MTTRTILLTGARGGHGTTTVAAALALYAAEHGPTELRTDVASTAALVGAPVPVTDDAFEITENLVLTSHAAVLDHPSPHTVVIDAGTAHTAAHTPPADEHYVVLRGPCYVALATLLGAWVSNEAPILAFAQDRRRAARIEKLRRKGGRFWTFPGFATEFPITDPRS